MSNKVYNLATDLQRPTSILTGDNTEYPTGVNSTAVSPFTGSSINRNFYNLAVSAVDNTTRIVTLEGQSSIAEDSQTGYMRYTGRNQYNGAMYGGSTLTFSNIGSTLDLSTTSFPLTWSSPYYAFRVAVGNAIQMNGASVNVTAMNTNGAYTSLSFNSVTSTDFNNQTNFLTYLRSVLNKSLNTTDTGYRMSIVGNHDPHLTATWNTTPTNRCFTIYWNDGKAQEVATGATACKATVNITTAIALDNASITSVVQTAIRTAMLAVDPNLGSAVSVYNTGTGWLVLQGNSGFGMNTDRSNGGVYELTLAKVAGSDDVLSWLGWDQGTMRVYDYAKVLSFSIDSNNHLLISGKDASFQIAVQDTDGAGMGGFFNHFGITLNSTSLYYHSMQPDTSWTKVLNFGGGFRASSLGITGASTFGGAVTFGGLVTFSNSLFSVPGGLKIMPTYTSGEVFSANVAVAVDPSDGRVYKASNASSTRHTVIGVAITASSASGQTISVITSGLVAGFGSGLTTGFRYFLGSAGNLIVAGANDSIPTSITTGQYLQCIGIATNSTDLYVNPDSPTVVSDPTAGTASRISYHGNNGTVVAVASTVTVPFGAIDYDISLGVVSSPASYGYTSPGYYVAPATGAYVVTCGVQLASVSRSTLGMDASVYYTYELNATCAGSSGKTFTTSGSYYNGTASPPPAGLTISTVVYLVVGDTVNISLKNTGASAFIVLNNTANYANYLQIAKIGS